METNDLQKHIKEALDLFEKGQTEEAWTLGLKIIRHAENADIYYMLAETAYLKSDLDSAARYYSLAIKLNPKNSVYYFKLGIVFSLKGFFYEARQSYGKALRLEPENTMYNYALAYLYYINKQYDLSEKLVERILSRNKDNIEAVTLKAELLIEKGELAKAAEFTEKIEQSPDKDDFSFYVLSVYYFKLNLFEKALDNITKAVNLNENSPDYKYRLAQLYYKLGKYDEAVNICTKITEENPKYIPSYILLARLLPEKGDYERAISNLNKALDLDKNQAEAHYILGCINYARLEYEKAAENFKTALLINPNNEEYYVKTAECYYKTGNYKDSYSYYKEAADFDITNPQYRYYMAKCSVFNNDKENALACFSLMKRLAPLNIDYAKEYAEYVYKCGSKKAAVSILESVLKKVQDAKSKEELRKYINNLKKNNSAIEPA